MLLATSIPPRCRASGQNQNKRSDDAKSAFDFYPQHLTPFADRGALGAARRYADGVSDNKGTGGRADEWNGHARLGETDLAAFNNMPLELTVIGAVKQAICAQLQPVAFIHRDAP